MRGLALNVLDALPRNVTYADVRVVHRTHECVHVENDTVGDVFREESIGLGLRVLVEGQWGFAATPRLERAGIDSVIDLAVGQASAGRGVAGPATSGSSRLGGGTDAPPVHARWETPLDLDPFDVPVSDKIDMLLAAAAEARTAGSDVQAAEASMDFFRDDKVFASTEGAVVEQILTESGAGLLVIASDGKDVQRRSYPQSVPRAIRGQRGDFATAGYEHVLALDLVGQAARVGVEAVALLAAPSCPTEETTLVVSGTQMAMVIHETAGHAMELDRALGTEASLAGGTYASPDEIGRLRFGSPLVTIVADATLPHGLGSFGYDDEGMPAQRTDLVRDGVVVGYMSDRASAAELGLASSGAARADSWQRAPLVRMTNVCLEPGESSLEEMIGTTKQGVLVDMNKSLSIDDKRLSFRFGSEIGWEIRNGKRGPMLKNCGFSGVTPTFWAGCDAVGNANEWRLYGIPSCNKGEPLQVAHIGHGTVPARFRRVLVGAL